MANRERVEAHTASITPRALDPRAAKAPSIGIAYFRENAFPVTVAPFYISSYWVFWTWSRNRENGNSQAKWEVIISNCTLLTVISLEIWLAGAASRAWLTVISMLRVTAARDAAVGSINWNTIRAVITLSTVFTVYTSCVMLTINADPSTCIDAMDIQACLLPLNIWIIVTVNGMTMAVACFTLIALLPRGRSPAPLVVPGTTAIARLPTGVVLAFTLKQFFWIICIALLGMAIANTPPTNADIFYAVIIPPSDGWISLCFGDEMSKKGIGSEKTQADICSLGELPQGVRESKIFCAWSTIYQGHHNLTIFQRDNPGIFSSTKYIVILGDSHICLLPKLFQTIYFRVSKILPR